MLKLCSKKKLVKIQDTQSKFVNICNQTGKWNSILCVTGHFKP